MFEARLVQGNLLRKVIEAIKDLVTDANFDCTEQELCLQAMDSSHVSLVALQLQREGFEHYRCDKPFSMGEFLSDSLFVCSNLVLKPMNAAKCTSLVCIQLPGVALSETKFT